MEHLRIPPVTREFYEYLSKILTKPEVEPETYRDKLMYQAGMNNALKIIGRNVRESIVTGDPEVLHKPSALACAKDRMKHSLLGRILW